MYAVDEEYVPDIPKVEQMTKMSARKPPRNVSLKISLKKLILEARKVLGFVQ